MKTKQVAYWFVLSILVLLTIFILIPKNSYYSYIIYRLSWLISGSSSNAAGKSQAFLFIWGISFYLLVFLLILLMIWTKRSKEKIRISLYRFIKYVLISITAIVAYNALTFTYTSVFVYKEFSNKKIGIDSVRYHKK